MNRCNNMNKNHLTLQFPATNLNPPLTDKALHVLFGSHRTEFSAGDRFRGLNKEGLTTHVRVEILLMPLKSKKLLGETYIAYIVDPVGSCPATCPKCGTRIPPAHKKQSTNKLSNFTLNPERRAPSYLCPIVRARECEIDSLQKVITGYSHPCFLYACPNFTYSLASVLS